MKITQAKLDLLLAPARCLGWRSNFNTNTLLIVNAKSNGKPYTFLKREGDVALDFDKGYLRVTNIKKFRNNKKITNEIIYVKQGQDRLQEEKK